MLKIYCMYYLWKVFYIFVTGNDCRNIVFKKPIIGKAMEGHVIKSEEVTNARSCRVMCYIEPNCVSINVGPSEGGKHRCELNNATVGNQFMFSLENRSAYTFFAIEVKYHKRWCLYTSLEPRFRLLGTDLFFSTRIPAAAVHV